MKPLPGKIPESHQFLKPGEVARAIGRSRTFCYRAIEQGELRAFRVANALRIRLDDALAWIERNTSPHNPNGKGGTNE